MRANGVVKASVHLRAYGYVRSGKATSSKCGGADWLSAVFILYASSEE